MPNSRPDRCDEVPDPAEEKFARAGFARQKAINSATVFTGPSPLTISTLGMAAIRATPGRSRSGSKASRRYSVGPMPCEAMWLT